MDWTDNLHKRIIIDNGAHRIRYGSCACEEPLLQYQNMVAISRKSGQQILGDALDNELEEHNLIYQKPQVRGVVVDWDSEVQLWEQMLSHSQKDLHQCSLILTYHPGLPFNVQQRMAQVALEYFSFASFYPALSENMVREYVLGTYANMNQQFQLVIESSHSATYLVPFFDNEPINYAIKRLDIGGKLITNLLKETIYKYIQLKNEIQLTNQIKEEMCYISKNFTQDMKMKNGSHAKFFVLPDYETGKKGYAVNELDHQTYRQFVKLDKERFTVPECIFHPNDIGLCQNGIVQSVFNSLQRIHEDIRDYFIENIILTGGNTMFHNLGDRFSSEMRENTKEDLDTKVYHLSKEINAVYKGAYEFCGTEEFQYVAITKQDYEEQGFDKLQKMYFV